MFKELTPILSFIVLQMAYDPEGHRSRIVAAKQKSLEEYDKAIMTLSAGALGLSLTFIKDIAPKPLLLVGVILGSWICWLVSLSLTVISFYIAKKACDAAIEQLDRVELVLLEEELYKDEQLGKVWNTITKIINVVSGALFFLGVILLIIFVYSNLQDNHERSKTRSEANTKPAPSLSASPTP